jgi:putative two-component system response regulator
MSHHEKWDGSGYPNGLKGEEIPVEGRIMALADTYDALRTQRVYKSAFLHEDACRIIMEGDDRTMPFHFDPEVLKIFEDNMGLFEEMFEEGSEN